MRTWMAACASVSAPVGRRDHDLQGQTLDPWWRDVGTRSDLVGGVEGDRNVGARGERRSGR